MTPLKCALSGLSAEDLAEINKNTWKLFLLVCDYSNSPTDFSNSPTFLCPPITCTYDGDRLEIVHCYDVVKSLVSKFTTDNAGLVPVTESVEDVINNIFIDMQKILDCNTYFFKSNAGKYSQVSAIIILDEVYEMIQKAYPGPQLTYNERMLASFKQKDMYVKIQNALKVETGQESVVLSYIDALSNPVTAYEKFYLGVGDILSSPDRKELIADSCRMACLAWPVALGLVGFYSLVNAGSISHTKEVCRIGKILQDYREGIYQDILSKYNYDSPDLDSVSGEAELIEEFKDYIPG